MTFTPRFQHDCTVCVFKGQHGAYDVWFCAKCDGGTWIARYGNEGHEYASYPTFVLKTIRAERPERIAALCADEALSAIFVYVIMEEEATNENPLPE